MYNEILISVIVCCRNEEKYIARCIESLENQKGLPGNFEILVIDGMSDDRTIQIVEELKSKYQNIELLSNPQKVKPPAVNLGFKRAKGKFIAICDAHTIYDEYYLSNCLRILNDMPEVWCSGGPIVSVGQSNFGKAVAIAMSSFIGVGNAKHRFANYEGYAEMACFPIFRRDVLEKVGLYDEFFIINHDDEYCYRLRKAGGKVYLSPLAKSYYYVRNTPASLFKQYFTYGYWQIAFLRKHKIPIALRQLIPFLFLISVILLFIIGIIFNNLILSILLPVVYLMTLVIVSLKYLKGNNFSVLFYFPLAVIILHQAYAIGFCSGIFRFVLMRKVSFSN